MSVPGSEAVTAHPHWEFTLYVNNGAPESAAAVAALRRMQDDDLGDDVTLRIVDVQTEPALAVSDNVIALPTLVKRAPEPTCRLIGDLSDVARVRDGLGFEPTLAAPGATGGKDRPGASGVDAGGSGRGGLDGG